MPFLSHSKTFYWRRFSRNAAVFAGMVLLWTAACRKSVRTEDPRLKPLQELLDAQLPPGTSEDKVKTFLAGRGYLLFPSRKPGTVVAVIPAGENRVGSALVARVTFYFDATGKLNTYALEPLSGDAPK